MKMKQSENETYLKMKHMENGTFKMKRIGKETLLKWNNKNTSGTF